MSDHVNGSSGAPADSPARLGCVWIILAFPFFLFAAVVLAHALLRMMLWGWGLGW